MVAGVPVLTIDRSGAPLTVAVPVTVVLAVDTLSAGVGSTAALSTLAVLTATPGALRVAVKVNVAELPTANVAMVAVATPPALVKVTPAGPVSVTLVAPAGTSSVPTTPVAAVVPVPAVTTSV